MRSKDVSSVCLLYLVRHECLWTYCSHKLNPPPTDALTLSHVSSTAVSTWQPDAEPTCVLSTASQVGKHLCKIITWRHAVFAAVLIWKHFIYACVFVLQWWKPLHTTTESGPEECSHSAGPGCHRAQDPGSFLASSCAHQCYRGPCVCKSFVLFLPLHFSG